MAIKSIVGNTSWYIAVMIISAVTVIPFAWTLLTSFKGKGEIIGGMTNFLPREWSLDNYRMVFENVPFFVYLKNSLILALAGVFTNISFGALAGYTFAKLKFRGQRKIFGVFMASMMIPSVVNMIPLYLVLTRIPFAGGNNILGEGGIGLINTFWAVILPGAVGGYSIFFMKQFFETLPDALGEAAKIDGASEIRIFWNIYFRLAKTPLITLGIMTFQAGWNSFMWPMIVLSDKQKMTVQVGLAAFQYSYSTDYGPLMAGTVISTIPIIVIFVLAQKYYMQGIADVGIK